MNGVLLAAIETEATPYWATLSLRSISLSLSTLISFVILPIAFDESNLQSSYDAVYG